MTSDGQPGHSHCGHQEARTAYEVGPMALYFTGRKRAQEGNMAWSLPSY